MMAHLRLGLAFAAVCSLSAPARASASQRADPAALLSLIPADCWGFVQINNLRALDDTLARLLVQIGIEPLRMMELVQTRLNLGPQIAYDGSLAVVFMPADSVATMGTRAVLLFPCESIETLLSGFTSEKVSSNLWRADLVWGPTYIGRRGGFAIFGTTAEATTAVLNSSKPISKSISGRLREEFKAADVNLWVNPRRLLASDGFAERLDKSESQAERPAVFGTDSIFSLNRRMISQVESLHIALQINAARVKLVGTVLPVPDSVLSELLAFGAGSALPELSLLPDQPFIFAVAGRGTPAQMQTKAAEFDKLFESDLIKSGTDPQKLQQFRRTIKSLIGSIKGEAWALSTQPQSPEGLAAVIGVFTVDGAQRWIGDIQSAAVLLGEGFFVNQATNRYYKSVSFQLNADTITGVPVHHLVVDAPEETAASATAKLDYWAALGPAKRVVQIAAIDDTHVLVCVGDHPRVMAALIASARGQPAGLDGYAGLGKVKQFLPREYNMFMLFSPEELIKLGRTLARMQDKVELFPYQLEKLNTPIGVAVSGTKSGCRIEAIFPVDLVAGLYSTLSGNRVKPSAIKPPLDGH